MLLPSINRAARLVKQSPTQSGPCQRAKNFPQAVAKLATYYNTTAASLRPVLRLRLGVEARKDFALMRQKNPCMALRRFDTLDSGFWRDPTVAIERAM